MLDAIIFSFFLSCSFFLCVFLWERPGVIFDKAADKEKNPRLDR